MSAARYYELTNFLPDSVDVAIERKKKVITLPDWPEIKIFYFNPARMDLGVTEVREGDNVFHIFDIEKTVVDIIYYWNKIGIEETLRCLRITQSAGTDRLTGYMPMRNSSDAKRLSEHIWRCLYDEYQI